MGTKATFEIKNRGLTRSVRTAAGLNREAAYRHGRKLLGEVRGDLPMEESAWFTVLITYESAIPSENYTAEVAHSLRE